MTGISSSKYCRQELSDGYKDWFLVSSGLLVLSTAINSNTSIILRHLRKLHVASLNSSREIIFIILIIIIIFVADIQLHTPDNMDKLKLVFFGININH